MGIFILVHLHETPRNTQLMLSVMNILKYAAVRLHKIQRNKSPSTTIIKSIGKCIYVELPLLMVIDIYTALINTPQSLTINKTNNKY